MGIRWRRFRGGYYSVLGREMGIVVRGIIIIARGIIVVVIVRGIIPIMIMG